jgi:Tol biopolymer transport system component
MTDDGRTMLYTSTRSGTPQLWIMQTDGTGDRQLTQDPAGIASAILSGDGNVAYAVTLDGRLVKIAIASGAVEELVPWRRGPPLRNGFW